MWSLRHPEMALEAGALVSPLPRVGDGMAKYGVWDGCGRRHGWPCPVSGTRSCDTVSVTSHGF